jgi:hypothetical protein
VGEEPVEWNRNAWILPRRGGVEFLSLLDQALDGVNVVALDITIGETQLVEVQRRLDKLTRVASAICVLKTRIGSMVRRAVMVPWKRNRITDGTLPQPGQSCPVRLWNTHTVGPCSSRPRGTRARAIGTVIKGP